MTQLMPLKIYAQTHRLWATWKNLEFSSFATNDKKFHQVKLNLNIFKRRLLLKIDSIKQNTTCLEQLFQRNLLIFYLEEKQLSWNPSIHPSIHPSTIARITCWMMSGRAWLMFACYHVCCSRRLLLVSIKKLLSAKTSIANERFD